MVLLKGLMWIPPAFASVILFSPIFPYDWSVLSDDHPFNQIVEKGINTLKGKRDLFVIRYFLAGIEDSQRVPYSEASLILTLPNLNTSRSFCLCLLQCDNI